MTNKLSVEEAVELLKEKRMEINYQVNGTTQFSEALDMAIKSLEQQPCEDAISREEVLRHRHVVQNNDWIGCCVVRVDEITKLPSVTSSNDAIKEAYIKGYDYGVKDWYKSKTEPSEDCISRAEVLEFLKGFGILHNHDELRSNLIYGIMNLSPVSPQPKTGHWINGNPICPCCGEDKYKDLDADIWADWQPKYCPNCGAKMEVEE